MIDPHVHLRDWAQSQKETLAHGFSVAWRAGLSAVFEMPNTDPAMTSRETLQRRIADADRALESLDGAGGLFHGIYGGITADPDQVRHIAAARDELFPRVVGLKLFAGHSTGRMGVVTVAEQDLVWKTLAGAGYRGVVTVHAEREDLLEPERFSRDRPETWSDARPGLAEIASVQTQIALAEAAGFRGTLHIAHVTLPETARIIAAEGPGLPFRLTGAATPHHLMLTREDRQIVNPPLRSEKSRSELVQSLVRGDLAWLESDHAPHTARDKAEGAAGLPGIPGFRRAAEELLRGLVSPERFEAITGGTVREVFDLPRDLLRPNPLAREGAFGAAEYRELAREYPLDPYSGPWCASC